MKSIREKLMIPLIWFFTITPLLALFIFNIGITKTIHISVDNNLKSTAISSYSEINQVLREAKFQTDKAPLLEKAEEIRTVLYNNRRDSNVEIYLFNSSGQFINATGQTVSNEDSLLTEKIRSSLDKLNMQSIHSIDTSSRKYALMGYKVSGLYFSDNPYIVFVSSYNILDQIIAVINISLFAMIAVGIVIASVITDNISKKVEKSLKNLNKATERISEKEDFIPDETIEIREIHSLSNGISEMARKLKEYDASQKTFLQNVSHEIKNPLMAIQGYAEGLEKGIFDEPKEAGEIISKECIRLGSLLNQLLTLTKIENRQYMDDFQVIDLNEIIKEYIKILAGYAIKEKKEIHSEFYETPLLVRVNDELLHQCIINVGGNAIRYAEKNIDIIIEKEESQAVIKIKDDGPGFSEEEANNLFTKFYKGKHGMFGLGLAIAKEAAAHLGGEIIAQSKADGAIFIIKLPIY